MISDEERREVAHRLREVTDGERAAMFLEEILCGILGDRYCRDGEFQISDKLILLRLADLIEPDEDDMCCDVSDGGSVFECSRCGCAVSLRTAEVDVFENATYGPTLTMPNGRGGELSFCPHCGARIIKADGVFGDKTREAIESYVKDAKNCSVNSGISLA